jgi:hypothetical protein
VTSHLDLDALHLESGGHSDTKDAFCVMEAVAYFNHEPWSDQPECASPALTAFLVAWNDALSDDDRQRLKRFIPMVVGTRTNDADELARAWLATDWLVRSFAPAWLDLAGLSAPAARLRALDALTSDELATAALPIIEEARKEASAAWSAAESAAESAAWSAAWSTAWSAAWSAADEALRATVVELQDSAEDLVERMIAVGRSSDRVPRRGK